MQVVSESGCPAGSAAYALSSASRVRPMAYGTTQWPWSPSRTRVFSLLFFFLPPSWFFYKQEHFLNNLWQPEKSDKLIYPVFLSLRQETRDDII